MKTQIPSLSAEQVIDQRWLITDFCQMGGVSEIYKAVDRKGGDQCLALKMVKHELQTDDCIKHGFQTEISVLTGLPYLHHPNAPRFEAAGEWKGRIYLVTEFVTGTRLDAFLSSADRAPDFDAKFFLYLTTSLCGILQDLEWMQVIHGDIAPANVIRHSETNFKLIDFNFSRFLSATKKSPQIYYTHETSPGYETIANSGFLGESGRWHPFAPTDLFLGRRRFPGQLAYAAPERVLQPEEVDLRSDIFSFGLVLYQLLTAYLPFSASSLEEKKSLFDSEDPLHVCSRNPTVPRRVGDAVMAMIRKDPDERPTQIKEVAMKLCSPVWGDSHTCNLLFR